MNNDQPGGGGSGKKMFGIVLLLALAAVAAGVISQMRKPPAKPAEPVISANASATQTAGTNAVAGSFGALAGKWLRPDGGYVLEIKKAGEDGKLEAAYFNPSPINVSKAEATREGSLIKVVVELRDTGYPGCLYTLLFDQAKDTLRGTYFQAALGETYEISFERLKE